MANVWKINPKALEQATKLAGNYKVKHGMFATVPLVCKDISCPYLAVCTVDSEFRVEGDRCPMEIAAILARFDMWCKHFKIKVLDNDTIDDVDLTDATLIKDLVDIEVQILRAENKVAMDGDFLGLAINTVDKSGHEHYDTTVTPGAEFKLILLDKRYKILNQLNATRKDKIKEANNQVTPSKQAIEIFKKVSEKVTEDLDNIDFDNINIGNDIEEIVDSNLEDNFINEDDIENINLNIDDEEI